MSYIFINSLGISELLARILAAAGSLDYLLFACLAYFVIERYGRRKVRVLPCRWKGWIQCLEHCISEVLLV